MKKFLTDPKLHKYLLITILLLALFLRVFRIWYPNKYVFDEVYHAFTAKEYLAGHKEAWEYWTTPPPGVAYEWTHPPLAKELMAASMGITQSKDAWAYRLPGALMGVLAVWLVYLLAKKLFDSEKIALLSAFIFSLDGLNFVQSRTGMNDIYVVAFMLASLVLLVNKRFFFSAILLGLALASKWTGLYLLAMILIILFKYRAWKKLPYFILIPPLIYLASYIPFFALGHTFKQFTELQQQMWWYHSHLKATHDYASPWWSWPLNLKPVWYFVDYQTNTLSNIFASGNPVIFWLGIGAIILSIWDFIKTRSERLFIILLGFFAFWLPWAISPRIMFLYHYSPSIPFLSIILSYQISQFTKSRRDQTLLYVLIGLILLGFLFVFPVLTGIPLPRNILSLFFHTNLTKNPFGSL